MSGCRGLASWSDGAATGAAAVLIPEPYEIDATGHEYVWTYTYPGADGRLGTADDVAATTDLHIPVDVPVRLYLHSSDYVYFFGVPHLDLRQIADDEVAEPDDEGRKDDRDHPHGNPEGLFRNAYAFGHFPPSLKFRHPREGGDPSPALAPSGQLGSWVPAFAGMTMEYVQLTRTELRRTATISRPPAAPVGTWPSPRSPPGNCSTGDGSCVHPASRRWGR